MKKTLLLVLVALMTAGMVFAGGDSEAPAESEAAPAEDTLKAGFIYIGPAGDFGWTYAHEQGTQYAEKMIPGLEAIRVESVPEGDAVRFIDRLVQEQGVDAVFTTSFGYMEDTVKAAAKYPDVKFFHTSGYKTSANMGNYMADMYQIYYMNGLMAGALTETDQIGYVAAFPIPELFRHMNAFAIGVKEVNPEATISVKWTYTWYGPDKAREASEALIAEGCDILGFTEDTPTVIEVAQEYQDRGESIWALSHYSPMQAYGPEACFTGQLTDWGPLVVQMLTDLQEGKLDDMSNYALLDLLDSGSVELGADWDNMISPAYVETFKGITTESADFGSISIYDLVMKRYEQMADGFRGTFDPFTGPLYDQDGNMVAAEGEVLGLDVLFGTMDYQLDNFITPAPTE